MCTNYHGRSLIPPNLQLKDLEPFATQYYNHRPTMIKYYHDGVTLLIFTSFKFRLMGAGNQHLFVLSKFLEMLPVKIEIGEYHVTYTVSYQLPIKHVNLHKLSPEYFHYEPELFPSAYLRHEGREHVNIFASGKTLMTGIRDLARVNVLIQQIMNHL